MMFSVDIVTLTTNARIVVGYTVPLISTSLVCHVIGVSRDHIVIVMAWNRVDNFNAHPTFDARGYYSVQDWCQTLQNVAKHRCEIDCCYLLLAFMTRFGRLSLYINTTQCVLWSVSVCLCVLCSVCKKRG